MTTSASFAASGPLSGTFAPPADKSILHRALLLAAMTCGESRITAVSSGADVASTAACLTTLGARLTSRPGGTAVSGTGWQLPAEAELDAGNSGTSLRLLSGAVAGRPGRFRLTGDASLSRRPMRRIAQPLQRMGARVELTPDGTPPVVVAGGDLTGISYELPVASAQVKSCVLLAGMFASGTTTVVEPISTRDHTERMLEWLGCPVRISNGSVSVFGGPQITSVDGFDFAVPGDVSSAAFLVTAACLVGGSHVAVRGVGLNPGRTGFIEVLRQMGADIYTEIESVDPEPVGSIHVESGSLRAVRIGGALIPTCVDELPLLALAATQADGETIICDAGDLRHKEADRISVLADGLNELGADIETTEDGMRITGPTRLRGGTVHSRGDHRMALTFAVAGLIASGPVRVEGWDAARISYPEFVDDLAGLRG